MKLHKSIYKTLFVIALFLQCYIDSVEFIVVFTGTIAFLVLLESKVTLSKSTFNIICFLSAILILGSCIGFFGNYKIYDWVRDVIHFIKPITVILAGFLLTKKVDNTYFIFKSIVFVALGFAIHHLINLAIIDLKIGNIEEIRLLGGSGNFIEVVAFVLLIYFYKNSNFKFVKPIFLRDIFILIFGISIFFYFSRTMFAGLLVIFLSLYGYTKLSRKMLEYLTVGLVLFSIFFAYLFTLDIDQDKPGINNFLFKIRNAPAEIFSTPDGYDPRNHKEIFRHWRGYEAKQALDQMQPINFVIGKGFGAQIDLAFKAPVGGENGLRYIPHLHNGYVYILYKTGIIGLLLYIILLFNLYKQNYIASRNNLERFSRNFIAGLGIYFMATSFVITGLYNLGEVSIFCLGVFLSLINNVGKTATNEL